MRLVLFSTYGMSRIAISLLFFFNDTATTEIYTLSLHDALPIFRRYEARWHRRGSRRGILMEGRIQRQQPRKPRSEEHTSELQSRLHLVCRLLLEKKKKKHTSNRTTRTTRANRNSEAAKTGNSNT